MYLLERTQHIPADLHTVFEFFADAMNLEAITPPFLHFSVLTPPPIEMRAGTLIDYRLRLFGVPLRWRTEIELFEPNRRFVDRQLRGPYKLWRHEHRFTEVADGVEMVDRVEYAIGRWLAGRAAHGLFVRRTLDRIFDYRAEKIAVLLGSGAARMASASG